MGKIKNNAKQLFLDLDGIYEQCQYRDWDCNGADPVTKDTIKACKLFLKALPIDILSNGQGISADPDGEISVEWYKIPERQISISIGADKLLTYAYMFKRSRQSGTEPFNGRVVPEHIVGLIRKVVGG